MDLILPLGDVIKRCSRVAREADNEDVGSSVSYLSIGTKVLVTRSIMNLKLDFSLLDIFGASIDIQNGWLILIVELIFGVVYNQFSFTNRCVAY